MGKAIMFDTLAYTKKLIAAGVPEKQAEALAEIIDEQIATKKDLAELKADIIKWVAGMLIAQSAVIAALVKLL